MDRVVRLSQKRSNFALLNQYAMKTLSLFSKPFLFAFLMLFVACDDMSVSTGDGSTKVKGNGIVATEVREIPPFNQIVLEGVFNVYILQKEKESIRIQTDENVLPFVITEVDNNILTVKLKDDSKITKMKKISVYITMSDIHKLETKGVGLLHCMGELNLKALELNLKGVGASKLNLNCDTLNVNSELVGSLHLSGKAKEVIINHKGIGSFEAFDFKAENVNLTSDGIGKAEVYASKELTIDAKGLGGVKYKGNPTTKNIKNEGVGVVASAE